MAWINCPKCGKRWHVSDSYLDTAIAKLNCVCSECREKKNDKFAGWKDTLYRENSFKHPGRGVERHTAEIAASGQSPDTYLPDGTLIESTGSHEANEILYDALDSGRYSK